VEALKPVECDDDVEELVRLVEKRRIRSRGVLSGKENDCTLDPTLGRDKYYGADFAMVCV